MLESPLEGGGVDEADGLCAGGDEEIEGEAEEGADKAGDVEDGLGLGLDAEDEGDGEEGGTDDATEGDREEGEALCGVSWVEDEAVADGEERERERGRGEGVARRRRWERSA